MKWKDLTDIQKSTIPRFREKKDMLVIAPTASGKTESVLIPVFDDILKNNLEPMSVLFVSPLKALINDTYQRIEFWCNHFDLTVTKWHGDVQASQKSSFIKKPSDILLITPESLEVILMNKSDKIKKAIFKNLQYIIIDEIHYFADSDRGTQLNSIINSRIKAYCDNEVSRIGLSATVGNPETILNWLTINENSEVVADKNSRPFQYKVIYADDFKIIQVINKYRDKKVVFFVHSRKEAEKYNNLFKKHLNIKNIFIHHSSIHKDMREENESNFKLTKNGLMISTSTLELGIDIGNIDIVIQKNPPSNVSSFLQKVGRSGRRTKIQRTIVFCDEEEEVAKTLALLSLMEEGKLEHIKIPEKPKDIYFHQILSTIFEYGRIEKKDLFFSLQEAYVFSNIEKEEYISFIDDMIQKGFIEESGPYLSLGDAFEREFGKRNFLEFYSVFWPNYEFSVQEGNKTIGSLDASFVITTLKNGSNFVLGGEVWTLTKTDNENFRLLVKKAKEGVVPNWKSEGGTMDYLLSRKIHDILIGNYNEELLGDFDEVSKKIIKDLQEEGKISGFEKGKIPVQFSFEDKRVFIYTFAGFKVNSLISSIFKFYHDVGSARDTPYYSSFKYGGVKMSDIEHIAGNIKDILEDKELEKFMLLKTKKFIKNKFIKYLPKQDQAELRMQILFNKEDCIGLFENNSLKLIDSSEFNKW
ncbi:DEAD/DEAH box helicase [Methanobacterium sp. ACI-7]|uniref:DEAD/DEAH box helicase n=1 Tax=unclassified Methanobacterium TaxID=2627676 RepID=UPI0039C0F93A